MCSSKSYVRIVFSDLWQLSCQERAGFLITVLLSQPIASSISSFPALIPGRSSLFWISVGEILNSLTLCCICKSLQLLCCLLSMPVSFLSSFCWVKLKRKNRQLKMFSAFGNMHLYCSGGDTPTACKEVFYKLCLFGSMEYQLHDF